MECIKSWEEKGVKIPAPYARTIKVLLAPDQHNVPDITFSFALIDPNGKTDYHSHDRPEMIYIVSGRGQAICDEERMDVQADMVLGVRAEEKHQMINTGAETLKLTTVFIPAYTAEENYNRCLKAATQIEAGAETAKVE